MTVKDVKPECKREGRSFLAEGACNGGVICIGFVLESTNRIPPLMNPFDNRLTVHRAIYQLVCSLEPPEITPQKHVNVSINCKLTHGVSTDLPLPAPLSSFPNTLFASFPLDSL
eukprot:1356070-Amorphochlora_amoeboformis.AAC.1